MGKKGFTLIEISISVALLSVILLFVVNLLTIIRRNEDDIALETKLQLNKSIISQAINEDIVSNNGIKNVECSSNSSCEITLNNDKTRHLYVTKSDASVIHYVDTTNNTNRVLFTRKSIEDYDYRLSLNEETLVTIITLEVINHGFYNVEFVSKN